jgi:uncharacterized protein (TIGR02271 family)
MIVGESGTNVVIPLYQESLRVGKREVDEGQVRLKKVVKTETVNQPITLRRETIVIEREPASGQSVSSGGQAFQEQEMVIPLRREEAVVETDVVSAGRVVASKRSTVEQSSVQREVRREEIDVDKGTAQNVIMSESAGGTGDSGGKASGYASGEPITDISTITSSSDPLSLAQRPVRFSNCKVQRVIGPQVFAVSDDGGKPLYVKLSQPMDNIKAGDSISVWGTAKQVPATTRNWNLGEDVARALRDQHIYVDAQKCEVNP